MPITRPSVVLAVALTLTPAVVRAATVTLAWDANPESNVTGYIVSYGLQPRGVQPYTTSVDIGNVTQWVFTPASVNFTYYFAVQAKNSDGFVSGYSAEVMLEPIGGTPVPRISGDFNVDGKIDLVWQNRRTGMLLTWFMNGTTMVGSSALGLGSVSDTNWKIVGLGDFNGDGRPDLLWQHQVTRLTTVWLMNGTAFLGPGLLSLNVVNDSNWEIRAVGDMNNDGWPDIIWQQKATGVAIVWIMRGLTFVEGRPLATVTDKNWKIVGTGDFDGDGHRDLVWQHDVTGLLSIWRMDGNTYLGGKALYPDSGPSDPDWRVVGVADLNGDTHPDLLLQHRLYGYIATWLMNGTTRIKAALLNPGQLTDLAWQIVAPN